MICPKCKTEYRDGFTECSDCGVDLINDKNFMKDISRVNETGIRIIKFGILLLFLAFTKMVTVIIAYEFNFTYLRTHGHMVDVNFNEYIHPFIWAVIAIEIIISVIMVIWGMSYKEKPEL